MDSASWKMRYRDGVSGIIVSGEREEAVRGTTGTVFGAKRAWQEAAERDRRM
jgi:hypothetical protein